uniref:Luciferin 4-monooxygenase n=1 Tax=Heliothis virescens TaxID=7102 RepID=A0A2A4J232_HELVI
MSITESTRGVIYKNYSFSIPSHMNYGKMVIDYFMLTKNKVALINGMTGERVTFGEMVQLIVNAASSLMRLGVKRDEVVAVCSENRTEFLITSIAAWCSGATVTYLNAAYGKNELVHTMSISKPKYVFLSPETYSAFYETMVGTKMVDKFFIFGDSVNDTNLLKFNDLIKTYVNVTTFEPNCDPINGLAQTALILYSSGTTGLPKGAKLTHLNLITSGNQPRHIKKELICLSIAPWSNTVGIVCTMDELLFNRTVLFLARFKEEQYLECIQKYRVGVLLVVPPLLVMLTKSELVKNYDVSSVEYFYCGGAPLDLTVMTEVKKRFTGLKNILQGYGMTETTGGMSEETDVENKPGSLGKVVAGNIVKIVDVETGKTLGPNQEGEVCVKGPTLFAGYIGKNLKDEQDEEGFFKTGDICYYDEDGYFYFVDRIKELIKYKAGQVAPSELEAILLQHPGVKDVGVTGKPDELAGELPAAFVVKFPESTVTERELVDFVAGKVSSWKQLKGGVYFVDEIPKTPSGKILRRVLRDSFKKPASKL